MTDVSVTSCDDTLRGCPHCGLVQRLPSLPAKTLARCARCREIVYRPDRSIANRLTAAISLAALLLYPLGIFLPVMKLEQLGHVQNTSIWEGTVSLLTHHQIAVGLIVLVCSVVVPVCKLVGLLIITAPGNILREHHQARIYRAIEIAGRWGMIDVLLVALVVAAVKLGDVVEVTPGPGVVAFTACVMLSLLASAVFNPHAIWESAE